MDKIEQLRYRIAELAVQAEAICREHGLASINKVTISVRDESNPEMWIVVSDDPACDIVHWYLPDDSMPDAAWVLVNIRPNRYEGETQDPDYVAIGMYDQYDKRWRTRLGKLPDGHNVTAWCRLPSPCDAR